METLRSSLPLRLRQLLSGQGAAPFPSLKESEPVRVDSVSTYMCICVYVSVFELNRGYFLLFVSFFESYWGVGRDEKN